jgi:hypothetical protein
MQKPADLGVERSPRPMNHWLQATGFQAAWFLGRNSMLEMRRQGIMPPFCITGVCRHAFPATPPREIGQRMTDSKRRLLGMGIPFALAFLPDTALSMYRHMAAVDGLLFRALARLHPEAIVLGYLVWAGAIVGLMLLTPNWIAMILTIAVVFGHVAGFYSQLSGLLGNVWYQAANALFLLAAVALGTGLWWAVRAASLVENSAETRALPVRSRWWMISFFFLVALCTILNR